MAGASSREITRQIQEDEYVFNQNKMMFKGLIYETLAVIGEMIK